MEGKREEGVRKGPWKAEEDEVLLKHVKKYGPRDWSSIRSKGLLERTGKSCRLRWVNKLRPHLKNGCKFSLEEERIVIELQTQFGNKWARIATYLPGRTDNDVKNFWSSRQKRLARILHTSSATSSSKSHKNKNKNDATHYDSHLPTLKDPTFSVTSEAEAESSSKAQSVSSFCIDNSEIIKMVPFQDLVKPKLFSFEQDLLRPVLNPTDQSLYIDFQSHIPFPPPTPFHHQLDLTFPSETQQPLAGLNDFYSDISAPMDAFKFHSVSQLPAETPLSALPNCYGNNARETIDNFVTTAGYFDDFPANIFDQMEEPFPNPSSSD